MSRGLKYKQIQDAAGLSDRQWRENVPHGILPTPYVLHSVEDVQVALKRRAEGITRALMSRPAGRLGRLSLVEIAAAIGKLAGVRP